MSGEGSVGQKLRIAAGVAVCAAGLVNCRYLELVLSDSSPVLVTNVLSRIGPYDLDSLVQSLLPF